MNKIKWCLLFLAMLGLTQIALSQFKPKITQFGSKKINLSAYHAIDIAGNIDVHLHTGFIHPSMIIKGDSRDLAQLKFTVVNNKLLIKLGKGYPRYGNVMVDIKGRYLNEFRYKGQGQLNGAHLNTSLLDAIIDNKGRTTLTGNLGLRLLDVKGNGYTEIVGVKSPNLVLKISGHSKVKLQGMVNLTSLSIEKDALLSLYWLKSNNLTIRAHDNGYIQLAGIVDKLDVELWDKAHFHGKYLRANRSFVKTHNQSVAEISTLKRQHTLATDNSDIHFYHIPEMDSNFMAYNGAVLDMRDLGWPFIQEYDLYNK